MTVTINRHALVLAALAIVLVVAATVSPAYAGTTGNTVDLNDVFSSAGAGTISFFSWRTILNFIVYVVLPILAILGAAWCINNIRDNPQPGNVVSNAIAIAFMLGICLVCVAIPGKIQASQTGGASGALLPVPPVAARR